MNITYNGNHCPPYIHTQGMNKSHAEVREVLVALDATTKKIDKRSRNRDVHDRTIDS